MVKTETKPEAARETAREDRRREPLPTITCDGCGTKVDALNPNCRCFRG